MRNRKGANYSPVIPYLLIEKKLTIGGKEKPRRVVIRVVGPEGKILKRSVSSVFHPPPDSQAPTKPRSDSPVPQ